MPHQDLSAKELLQLHRQLCFQRAFPTSRTGYDDALKRLNEFEAKVSQLPRSERERLSNSGISGTHLNYRFSFPVAKWLAKTAPGAVSIDWPAVVNDEQVDDLLRCILEPSEDEYFDSGYATSRDWLDLARCGNEGTDFDWLLAQYPGGPAGSIWKTMYDAADLPLSLDLSASRHSRTLSFLPPRQISVRSDGMRRHPHTVKKEIHRPVTSIRKVSGRYGAQLVDLAMASLAVRHRETNHFNHANPDEVYVAGVGEGVSIVVFGLLPRHRYPLEHTTGYLIVSNGVAIGYGGASAIFQQLNTGINIFDEYRGSEASYLWVQVLRVYHSLVGCNRIIVNPYQFGSGNTEALKSGAFWFYYRLGFRPVMVETRALALHEARKKQADKSYRCSAKVLRELACGDMHLRLPGARQGNLFDEDWLATSAMLATRMLADSGRRRRRDAVASIARELAENLDLRSLNKWTSAERHSFEVMAPIVAAASPGSWPTDAKRDMRRLLRAKGGQRELQFAQLMSRNRHFFDALRRACCVADAIT